MKYILITLALLTASVTHASDYLSLSCNLVTNKGAEMPMTAKLDLQSGSGEIIETGNIYSGGNFVASPTSITLILPGATQIQISREDLTVVMALDMSPYPALAKGQCEISQTKRKF